MKASLVVVEGRPHGAVIPLKADRFEIGRGEGCQLRPRSQAVSSRHCALIRRGRDLIVEDLGSTNGTLVNSHCLRGGDAIRVNNGDRLQVGQLIFKIQLDPDSETELPELEEWLMPSGAEPVEDPNLRTLLLAASPVAGPSPGVAEAERIKMPPETTASAKFAFRTFDEGRRVVCVGLSQSHMAGEPEIRNVRKALYDMTSHRRFRRLVLDLGGVDVLPSMAVAMFLALARRCAEGGGLRICGLLPNLGRKFTRMRLDRVIERYDSQTEAIIDPWV